MNPFTREPAVMVGLIAALATVLAQYITDNGVNWYGFVPVALGIITRFLVSPAYGDDDEEPDEPIGEPPPEVP